MLIMFYSQQNKYGSAVKISVDQSQIFIILNASVERVMVCGFWGAVKLIISE